MREEGLYWVKNGSRWEVASWSSGIWWSIGSEKWGDESRFDEIGECAHHGDDPTLPKLLAALGWQGGTVEQALAEVSRLKALDVSAMVEVGSIRVANNTIAWIPLPNVIFAQVGKPEPVFVRRASTAHLGQGVAALLPEHGEAFCGWAQMDEECEDYDTGCGNAFSLASDEFFLKFCPWCGKKIERTMAGDHGDDTDD